MPHISGRTAINDGLDSSYRYPPFIVRLLDSPAMQRAGRVVQNGFGSAAYSNLNHTRKGHMIGTARRAEQMWQAARVGGPHKTNYDHLLPVILAAAFLHDIGHYPFSHNLESVIEPYSRRSHEEISADLISGRDSLHQFFGNETLDKIIGKTQRERTYKFLKDIPRIVSQLIHRKPSDPDHIGRNHFLREFVDGKLFDADSIDYLQRDPSNAGLPGITLDPGRIINCLGLVQTEGGVHLAIDERGLLPLTHLQNGKQHMYNEVYTNKAVLKFEAMFNEACKRFLRALGPEMGPIAESLYLLTDRQLENFFTSYDNADPIASNFFLTLRYNRENKYGIAFEIDANKIPNPAEGRSATESQLLYHKLLDLRGIGSEQDRTRYANNEQHIKQQILDRANAGSGKPYLEEHEVIVYFPNTKRIPTREEQRNKFKLHVFNRSGDVYHAPDRLSSAGENDYHNARLEGLFNTFSGSRHSRHFMVLAPKQHLARVQRAAHEYTTALLRDAA